MTPVVAAAVVVVVVVVVVAREEREGWRSFVCKWQLSVRSSVATRSASACGAKWKVERARVESGVSSGDVETSDAEERRGTPCTVVELAW